ncbi:MAG: hypothetical protein ACOYL5_09470, partial [Phototrophicaceae bacterium]
MEPKYHARFLGLIMSEPLWGNTPLRQSLLEFALSNTATLATIHANKLWNKPAPDFAEAIFDLLKSAPDEDAIAVLKALAEKATADSPQQRGYHSLMEALQQGELALRVTPEQARQQEEHALRLLEASKQQASH